MAKIQTRRSISVPARLYASAGSYAAEHNLSLSHLVELALQAYGVPVVGGGVHVNPATRSVVVPERRVVVPLNMVTGDSFDRGETAAVTRSEPPVTRLDLDAMAAARRAPPPGTSCANCIDAPATHRGRCDNSGELYWLCSECELPDDAAESTRGRGKRRSA